MTAAKIQRITCSAIVCHGLVLSALFLATARAAADQLAAGVAAVHPLVARYCLDCH